MIALFQQTMMSVENVDSGTASGSMQALQHVGMALGVGILGQVYFITIEVSGNPLWALENSTVYCGVFFAMFSLLFLRKLLVKAN